MKATLLLILLISSLATAAPAQLLWPIECVPGDDCAADIGYADPQNKGKAHNCRAPGYNGHEGTDILLRPANRMDKGVNVYAAAAGKVLWAFDGKFDRCPNIDQPDCLRPHTAHAPGNKDGTTVCTPLGPFCKDGAPGNCFWCFAGGNVVVIRHEGLDGVFATRYDHLKKGSVKVKEGDTVKAGQVIGQAASAGHSTAPHLHFEVWGRTYYDPVNPWAGPCNSRVPESLWKFPEQPWQSLGRKK